MLNSCFDAPWVDFMSNVNSILHGKSELPQSRLFQFLKPEIQHQITEAAPSLQNQVDMLKTAYEFHNVRSFWEYVNISREFISKNIRMIRAIHDDYVRTTASRDWILFDKCVLQEGTPHMMQFLLLLTFKRFHHDFKMHDFLACWIYHKYPADDIPADNLIVRQMIASRVNFIVNGTYLPIVTVMNTVDHTTAYLLLPRMSDQVLVWNIVNINSNGEAEFRSQFKLFESALQTYEKWVSTQEENATSKIEIFCWENIQKKFGTCSIWSIILCFQFLANYSQFLKKRNVATSRVSNVDELGNADDDRTNSTDMVDTIDSYCKELAKRMSFYVIINRFNNYLSDLMHSFRFLLFEVLGNYGMYNLEQISQFETAVFQDPISRTIILDMAIFAKVEKIRRHLEKYIYNPAKFTRLSTPANRFETGSTEEYETDDETQEESVRNEELRTQIFNDKLRQEREARDAAEKKARDAEDIMAEDLKARDAAVAAAKEASQKAKITRLKHELYREFKYFKPDEKRHPSFFQDNIAALANLCSLIPADDVSTVRNFESVDFSVPSDDFIRSWLQDQNNSERKNATERIESCEKSLKECRENVAKMKGEMLESNETKNTQKELQTLEKRISSLQGELSKLNGTLKKLQSVDVDAEVERFKIFIDQSVNYEKPRERKRTREYDVEDYEDYDSVV